MYTLALVQTQAREEAQYKGHVLGTFRKTGGNSAIAECMRCGKKAKATVTKHQRSDVAGEATLQRCK